MIVKQRITHIITVVFCQFFILPNINCHSLKSTGYGVSLVGVHKKRNIDTTNYDFVPGQQIRMTFYNLRY
jgi:hypothetical protein